jgi:hypothetical protein
MPEAPIHEYRNPGLGKYQVGLTPESCDRAAMYEVSEPRSMELGANSQFTARIPLSLNRHSSTDTLGGWGRHVGKPCTAGGCGVNSMAAAQSDANCVDTMSLEPSIGKSLLNRLASLDEGKLELLSQMVESMAGEAVYRPPFERGSSDLATPPFVNCFSNFLLLHHGMYEDPLNKEAFEYLFKIANQAAGRHVTRNRLRGSATHDVRVDDTRWSLKTEAGKSQSANTIKIEKWMEARWVRECHNPTSCVNAMHYVVEHMNDFERIAVLKAWTAKDGSEILYRLLELPKASILKLGDLPHQAFTKEGAKMSYGANLVGEDGSRILRILLDSSVEKVRIWYSADHAIDHGSWRLALSSDRAN